MSQDSKAAAMERVAEFWAQDLEQRMALARPDDTIRGVFCNGLLRFAWRFGGEESMKRCLEAGGEEKFIDFFNYPVSAYLRMVSSVVLPLATRNGGVEEALKSLGRQAVMDIRGSAAGKALAMMITGDMRSLLESLQVAFRVASSCGQYVLAWTGPASARFTLRHVFMPLPFHEGLLLEVLEEGSGRSVMVLGRQLGLLDSEFEISWE